MIETSSILENSECCGKRLYWKKISTYNGKKATCIACGTTYEIKLDNNGYIKALYYCKSGEDLFRCSRCDSLIQQIKTESESPPFCPYCE